MIDHLSLRVADYKQAKSFFTAALAPLGYEVLTTFEVAPGVEICGMGTNKHPDLWLMPAGPNSALTTGQHIALRAENPAAVDAFYKASLAAGAKDNGGPGRREMYSPSYYGAFIVDPTGNFLEACCHTK